MPLEKFSDQPENFPLYTCDNECLYWIARITGWNQQNMLDILARKNPLTKIIFTYDDMGISYKYDSNFCMQRNRKDFQQK